MRLAICILWGVFHAPSLEAADRKALAEIDRLTRQMEFIVTEMQAIVDEQAGRPPKDPSKRAAILERRSEAELTEQCMDEARDAQKLLKAIGKIPTDKKAAFQDALETLNSRGLCEAVASNAPAACSRLQGAGGDRASVERCEERFVAVMMTKSLFLGEPSYQQACARFLRLSQVQVDEARFCRALRDNFKQPAALRRAMLSGIVDQQTFDSFLLGFSFLEPAEYACKNPKIDRVFCRQMLAAKTALTKRDPGACGQDALCSVMLSPGKPSRCEIYAELAAEKYCGQYVRQSLAAHPVPVKAARAAAQPSRSAVERSRIFMIRLHEYEAAEEKRGKLAKAYVPKDAPELAGRAKEWRRLEQELTSAMREFKDAAGGGKNPAQPPSRRK